jgi:TonB family protein
VAVVKGGEDRLRHPVDPDSHGIRFSAGASVDVSQQGFAGVSEGLNLRSLPLSQQEAVMAATGDPANWLEVEIEISVDGGGNVTQMQVVMPSGRRAFDRYVLQLVAERVSHATPRASISRWVCRAGYAASRPDAIGVNFDLSMPLDKQLRKQLSLQYPLKERVETRVSLKWVKSPPWRFACYG